MARTRALVPVIQLARPIDPLTLEPGAYLVRVSKRGEIETQRLPKGALLIDGTLWETVWSAFHELRPHQVEVVE